jgi:hypothetical protein
MPMRLDDTGLVTTSPPQVVVVHDAASWTQYLPLMVALLSAVVAVVVARASVYFAARRTERNCGLSLLAEVHRLCTAIAATRDEQNQTTYARARYLLAPEQLCSIYRGAGPNLGLLKAEVLSVVVEFYAKVLTLRPTTVRGIDDAFSGADLDAIVELGDHCQQVIANRYGG